jgi:hypothetical protein
MFHKNLPKDWLSAHLLDYGWYLDYPKDYIPLSKITFHMRIEHGFQSKLQGPLTIPTGASKKRGGRRGKSRLKILKTL